MLLLGAIGLALVLGTPDVAAMTSRVDAAGAHSGHQASNGSEAGGFLDITVDFVVYGATVVGVAIGVTWQYDAAWLPFLLVGWPTT